MAEIVESDESGRIVIPKGLRREMGIGGKTKFIIRKGRDGQITLTKIDVEEMARRLEEELEGKDVDAIAEQVRREINEKAKRRYPSLSPGQ